MFYECSTWLLFITVSRSGCGFNQFVPSFHVRITSHLHETPKSGCCPRKAVFLMLALTFYLNFQHYSIQLSAGRIQGVHHAKLCTPPGSTRLQSSSTLRIFSCTHHVAVHLARAFFAPGEPGTVGRLLASKHQKHLTLSVEDLIGPSQLKNPWYEKKRGKKYGKKNRCEKKKSGKKFKKIQIL